MVLVVVALMAYYGVAPTWRILATPIWLGLLVLAAFGIALWLCAFNVRYRDVQHALGPVMQIWFFASPWLTRAPCCRAGRSWCSA